MGSKKVWAFGSAGVAALGLFALLLSGLSGDGVGVSSSPRIQTSSRTIQPTPGQIEAARRKLREDDGLTPPAPSATDEEKLAYSTVLTEMLQGADPLKSGLTPLQAALPEMRARLEKRQEQAKVRKEEVRAKAKARRESAEKKRAEMRAKRESQNPEAYLNRQPGPPPQDAHLNIKQPAFKGYEPDPAEAPPK